MYYVYFIKSLKNGFIYIGSCQNFEIRLSQHNSGRVKSTKAYKPWVVLGYKTFDSRSEAMKAERFYKSGQQKEMLREKYKDI